MQIDVQILASPAGYGSLYYKKLLDHWITMDFCQRYGLPIPTCRWPECPELSSFHPFQPDLAFGALKAMAHQQLVGG